MPILKHLKRGFESLMLHRLRSLLSTLGILFGVCAVVAMLSIGEGAKQETLEQIGQLGMNTLIIRQNPVSEVQQNRANEWRSLGLTVNDSLMIKYGIPSINLIAPIKVVKASLPGALQKMTPEILAVTRSYSEIKSLSIDQGRFISDLDGFQKKLVCVLGESVAKALGQSGRIGNTLRMEDSLFEIVGVLKSSQWKPGKNTFLANRNINLSILIPLGSESLITRKGDREQEMLSEILIQIFSNFHILETAEIAKNILRRQHAGYEDYQVVIPQELLSQANQTQRTFNLVLGSIAAISLLVGGIGIMNMMLANVSERIREIGIRRAMGATRCTILLQFLTESIILTLAGALLGIICGLVLSYGISFFADWQTIVTLWSLLVALLMSVVVGICSGIYPAYRAAHLDPVAALRHL